MAHCCAKMQLFFKAEKLADKDITSKSDPYVILYSFKGGVCGHELGRTETCKDSLSPTFERCINVDYFFEQRQEMLVKVFDDDGKGPHGDDLIGQSSFQLSHVMSARAHCKKLDFGKDGCLYVTGAEVGENAGDQLDFRLCCHHLKKMDTFGLSDPYFRIGRVMPNGTKQPHLYESEVIDNTLDPRFHVTPRIEVGKLSGADPNEPTIYVEVFDKDMMSSELIGELRCSINQLSVASPEQPLILGKAQKKKTYGEVFVGDFRIIKRATFPMFLAAGWQVNLAVSIDFTGSNGDPTRRDSLHYMDPHQPNQYVRAIMSVGDILMEYDTDKMVPAFGFGAQINGQVSHFFHLNFQQNPYVPGIQGVLDSYGKALTSVRLWGPTNFAPTIRSATAGARSTPRMYSVLLIITDGAITDEPQTIDALVEADDAPLSIIIVGVGSGCDFESMNVLDADGGALESSRGKKSRRDLVQFVPFRDFQRLPQEALAAEVLKEVPGQFVRWAELVGATPTPM